MDYEFESVGPKGNVKKVVRFTKIDEGFFNLGFGDRDVITGKINDIVTTNNGDAKKILATIAMIVVDFTKTYPHSLISLQGTTASRTRLYQMNICKYYNEII